MDKHSCENRILAAAACEKNLPAKAAEVEMAKDLYVTKRIRVYGIVQGVGFRPTVSRHAAAAGIRGTVCNKGPYVEIIAQGSEHECSSFLELLKKEPPRRAAILKLDVKELSAYASGDGEGCIDDAGFIPEYKDFSIIESERTRGAIYISPDIAVCDDCRRELFDKTDRRYLHPFINCTSCGPRMTILDALPYDRERTSMKQFPMCRKCSEEYHSPKSRRFDAQPVCCNNCGPSVYILDKETGQPSRELRDKRAMALARKIIISGGIIAVKGIGGFHLCCDAKNEDAVSLLRARKHRPAKPFAVMMRNIEAVKRTCLVSEPEEELLTGHQKPIVLLSKGDSSVSSAVAPSVAPDNPKLGVMLPYAPIQLLLFDYDDGRSMTDCLVMTSANESGAPICRDDADALNELSELADVILSNDRLIRVRADDTVTDFYNNEPYMIRRSRGFAPLPVLMSALPDGPGSVIGIGGELKNSFCIGRGQLFYPSPYVGDLGDIRTAAALKETVNRFTGLLEARPMAICCDMHPLYQSRELAYELADELCDSGEIRVLEIQHHYAHILSCMAENDRDEPVIGVSFDGTGYGTDKTIWGGEILISDWNGFERFSHISPFIQVGGDISSKEGWRIAAQMLSDIYKEGNAADAVTALGLCSLQELRLISTMAERNINSVSSTSAGRLFDAVSAILGIRRVSTFEGEASTALMYRAMEYEALQENAPEKHCPSYPLLDDEGILSTKELVRFITEEMLEAKHRHADVFNDIARLSYIFHWQLAEMIAESVRSASEKTGIKTAALSGGVFQNTLLLRLAEEALGKKNIKVLRHHLIPPNDGGIGLGQAVYAMKHIGGL